MKEKEIPENILNTLLLYQEKISHLDTKKKLLSQELHNFVRSNEEVLKAGDDSCSSLVKIDVENKIVQFTEKDTDG